MSWFKKDRKPIAPSADKASRVPEGLWVKCPGCTHIIYNKDLATNLNVCPKCAHHFRISAAGRLRALFDEGHWTEHDQGLMSNDPLHFTDTKPYRDRLRDTRKNTGMNDAVVVATGSIDELPVVVAAMEYTFIGGGIGGGGGHDIQRGIRMGRGRRQPGARNRS